MNMSVKILKDVISTGFFFQFWAPSPNHGQFSGLNLAYFASLTCAEKITENQTFGEELVEIMPEE